MPKFPLEFSSRGTVKTTDKLMIHNIDTGATEYTTVAELFAAITIPDGSTDSATPQYVKPENIIFSEHSNVLEDWDVHHGTSNLDSINYLHSPTFANVKLTGINGNTSPYLTKKLPAPIDIRDKHIAFYYYIPKGSTIKYVNLHFDSSASNDALTDYYEIRVYDYASSVGGYYGWHLFTGSTGAFEWKTYGSPDWANIKYIRIYAQSNGTINSDVTVGPIYAFIPPNAKALVSIGMDGAYSGHLKAVNFANSKGIPVTLYVSEPLVGGVGRLTLTQLHDIKRWTRNLVASYIYPFQKHWQDMDLATQINAVKANATWLQVNGFGDGAKICSPPGVGVRSEDIQRLIMNHLIDIPGGFNGSESQSGNLWDVKSLYANVTPGSLTDVVLASLLSSSIAGKTVLFELWHSPYDYNNGTPKMWETHIDAIKAAIEAGQVEAVTPLDIWTGRISVKEIQPDATIDGKLIPKRSKNTK